MDIEELQKQNCSYDEKFTPPEKFIKYQEISEFPSSIRDISYLIKDSSKIGLLQDTIFEFKNSILKEIFIFDYYLNKKTNEIKMGFRFIFQSHESTLTVEEVDNVLNDIMSKTLKIGSIEIPGIQ